MREPKPPESAGSTAPESAGAEMGEQENDTGADPSPAREMSLHLLRMLETRMDAAGIALQGETQLVLARLQLRMLSAAAGFIAIWGGIVLLAIALPPDLRVPVLSGVVATFVLVAIAAHLIARRKASSNQIGSMRWFLDSLRQDLEVLSRALSRGGHQGPRANPPRSAPHDLAA